MDDLHKQDAYDAKEPADLLVTRENDSDMVVDGQNIGDAPQDDGTEDYGEPI